MVVGNIGIAEEGGCCKGSGCGGAHYRTDTNKIKGQVSDQVVARFKLWRKKAAAKDVVVEKSAMKKVLQRSLLQRKLQQRRQLQKRVARNRILDHIEDTGLWKEIIEEIDAEKSATEIGSFRESCREDNQDQRY